MLRNLAALCRLSGICERDGGCRREERTAGARRVWSELRTVGRAEEAVRPDQLLNRQPEYETVGVSPPACARSQNEDRPFRWCRLAPILEGECEKINYESDNVNAYEAHFMVSAKFCWRLPAAAEDLPAARPAALVPKPLIYRKFLMCSGSVLWARTDILPELRDTAGRGEGA